MGKLSPMMEQYFQIKNEYKDYILLYRLGDFYEMFYEDAKLASKELDLTLTGRDCGQEERAPMCGMPYHSCESYIARLIQKGYKVAICEQTEDPALAKGIVKREVVRIITPGTVTESSMLEENKNNFICSLISSKAGSCISYCDISTGEIYVESLEYDKTMDNVLNSLSKFSPNEVLLDKDFENQNIIDFLKNRLSAMVTSIPQKQYNISKLKDIVLAHFKCKNISEYDILDEDASYLSLGILLCYIMDTQKSDTGYLKTLISVSKNDFMELDANTRRNLELCETMRSKEKHGSLLWVLDKTKTAMGGRMIRNWICQPLTNISIIRKRQNAVEELVSNYRNLDEIRNFLSNIQDMERLMTRIVYKTANGRDLRALSSTISNIRPIKELMSNSNSSYLKEIYAQIDYLDDLYKLIDEAISEEPPVSVREGKIIKKGYNKDVDELNLILTDGKGWLAQIEAREKEATGIKNLKIGYNKVFGYYIEVTKSNIGDVPPVYIRKQTLTNCERYITDELKDLENKILSANDKIASLEYEIFSQVLKYISSQIDRVQKTAKAIARLDVISSFAKIAIDNKYVCPEISVKDEIIINEGRHPVVEKVLKNSLFVPNDTLLNCSTNKIVILTGPNMAGKSTYMRQIAIITLMSQIGSFVPAKYAKIGIVDKIFTRVGASDDLASGQSTFMLEMTEVAHILKNATPKSLLVLDEIGRGTSTFDGMSIAKSVIEYIIKKKKLNCKTLFATHYHELTDMENSHEGIVNYNVAVKKHGDEITFLRKILKGASDDSYGIQVAKLAGVPNEVVERAKEILIEIENNIIVPKEEKIQKNGELSENQMSFNEVNNNNIIKYLKKLSIDSVTPIEALNILNELIGMID